MSWAAVAGAAVMVGGSLLAGDSAGDAADAQMAQEARLREQEIGIQKDNLQFSKDVYGDHKAKFDPLFDDIRGMMDDVEPDYGAIAGDINMSFDTARGMEERNQRRYGIKPTDGAARQAQRDYGIRRGAAHVGARSQARQGAKDKRYGRYADLYNSGQGIGSSNASMVSNAMTGLGRAYGSNANAAGNNAAYYNQQSAQNAQGWGQMLGSVDWGGAFNSAKGWFNNSGNSAGGSGRPGV